MAAPQGFYLAHEGIALRRRETSQTQHRKPQHFLNLDFRIKCASVDGAGAMLPLSYASA
jgi:hypothetical protein